MEPHHPLQGREIMEIFIIYNLRKCCQGPSHTTNIHILRNHFEHKFKVTQGYCYPPMRLCFCLGLLVGLTVSDCEQNCSKAVHLVRQMAAEYHHLIPRIQWYT